MVFALLSCFLTFPNGETEPKKPTPSRFLEAPESVDLAKNGQNHVAFAPLSRFLALPNRKVEPESLQPSRFLKAPENVDFVFAEKAKQMRI